jgi:adhesin transport system outer membrane protein
MEQPRNAHTKQFKIGQRTLLDVLDPEKDLFTARIDYVNGLHDINFSVYRIPAGNGKLLWALPVPEEAAPLQ